MAAKSAQVSRSVVREIHQQIKTGKLRPGTTLPAEQELASTLGVSRGTVRRAIELLLVDGTLTRRPHSRPIISGHKSLKQQNEVYVWVSRPIADEQALILIREISKGLRGTTYRLVVREPTRFVGTVVKSEEREFLLSVLHQPEVAGAIIERHPFAENDDVIQQLVEQGKHLVFVDTPPPEGIPVDYVGTTNVTAARACVEHLLNQGHSRVLCVADSDQPPAARDRIKGYWRAMRQSGVDSLGKALVASELPRSEVSEISLGGQFARVIKKDEYFSDLATRIVTEFMKMDPRPTAMFVCHDVMAYWVCALLEGRGISIPGDVSVVGFDWLAKWDDAIPDTLTTAGQDFDGFGRHAANLLLDRLTGEAPSGARQVLLDAPLVIRSSTISDLMLPVSEPAHSTRAK